MAGWHGPGSTRPDRHDDRFDQRAGVVRRGNTLIERFVDVECATLGRLVGGGVVQHGAGSCIWRADRSRAGMPRFRRRFVTDSLDPSSAARGAKACRLFPRAANSLKVESKRAYPRAA